MDKEKLKQKCGLLGNDYNGQNRLLIYHFRTRLGAAASAGASAAAANPPSMDLDLPVDPNEPTYCFCNQVSYGEMVACDNPDVRIFSKLIFVSIGL